jgi:hypothetical protein
VNRMTLVSVSVCYAFALTASAQWPPPQLDPNNFGVIEGTVIDPRGKPVGGAYVYAVGDAEGKLPLAGRWPGGTSTTTDSEGKFVLGRVVVDNPVSVWASKESDYYAGGSIMNMGLVPGFNTPKAEEVEVKPGQTVTVRLQLAKKAGKIKLYVRDADTKKLVDRIFSEWCMKGAPITYSCGRMSGESDYRSLVSTDVDLSIRIEAYDGLHEEWEYRNPKNGSRYYRARSGKTETVNVYLRKTPWHKGTIWPEPPPIAAEPPELEFIHFPNEALEPPSPNRWDLRSLGELREGVILTQNEVRWTPELEYIYPTTDIYLYTPDSPGRHPFWEPGEWPPYHPKEDIFWLRRIGRFWKTRL